MVVFRVGVSGDLNAHRTAVPIDHPDGSVTRVKLEYPTVDVSFAYLSSINKAVSANLARTKINYKQTAILTTDWFTDKTVANAYSNEVDDTFVVRVSAQNTFYTFFSDFASYTADVKIRKMVNGTVADLAYEAVDVAGDYIQFVGALSVSGSTLKFWRQDVIDVDNINFGVSPNVSATDTSIASGRFGIIEHVQGNWIASGIVLGGKLLSSKSSLLGAVAVIETELGSDNSPVFSKNVVEVSRLTGLPDFLYREAKKYEILKAKGFTDEEMELLLGYVPKHQVDLDAVTWGAFELHPDKSPTAIVVVVGDNPYSQGAVERQKGKVKRWWSPPRGYNEAVELYRQLSRDYPHWLAGKDNFAYQVLGWEELDWLQNVDFYYGELVEHRTHYSQLKQVSDDEIRGRIEELIGKLSSMGVLRGERESHIAKAKEVLRRGW